jgi:hypothetical protein
MVFSPGEREFLPLISPEWTFRLMYGNFSRLFRRMDFSPGEREFLPYIFGQTALKPGFEKICGRISSLFPLNGSIAEICGRKSSPFEDDSAVCVNWRIWQAIERIYSPQTGCFCDSAYGDFGGPNANKL